MAEPPTVQSWNLYLRFGIELMALGGIWAGASVAATSRLRWLLVVTGLLVAVILWGVFNVPDDPTRSGKAPISVTGWVRLFIELVVLGAGLWGWLSSGRVDIAVVYAMALAVHHAASLPRLRWLVAQPRKPAQS